MLSFRYKLMLFAAVLSVCMFLGNLTFLLVVMIDAGSFAIQGSTNDIISTANHPYLIKIGIGINHLLTFTLSSLILLKLFYKKINLKRVLGRLPDMGLTCLFFILLYASLPAMAYIVQFLKRLHIPDWLSNQDEDYMKTIVAILDMSNGLDLVLNLIIVAALPAIGEELLFRGILQNELIKKLYNPHYAIFIASFLFSAFHLDIMGFIPKLGIGLILGYAYYMTNSLWAPMLLHFINNGFQIIVLYMNPAELSDISIKVSHTQISIWNALISILICLFVVRIISQRFQFLKSSE